MTTRRPHGLACVAAVAQPLAYEGGRNTGDARPFRNRSPFAQVVHKAIVSFVGALLLTSGPPAVAGAVSGVVVNAIQGVSDWGVAHIFKEQDKRKPSVAYGDTSPAIAGECFDVLVRASLNHGIPDAMNLGVSFPVYFVVCGTLAAPTTTASGIASYQVGSRYSRSFATVASTGPHDLSASQFVTSVQSCKPSKFAAGDVNGVRHTPLYRAVTATV